MKKNYAEFFLKMLEEHLPEGVRLVDALTDNLSLSKEAAYRRIRGEVPFILDDLCLLSKKYNISLDSLLDLAGDRKAKFEMAIAPESNIIDYGKYYCSVVYSAHEQYAEMLPGRGMKTAAACNQLPHILLFPYPYLSRFRMFQWMYQAYPNALKEGFASMQLPEDIFLAQKILAQKINSHTEEQSLIFGPNIISSFINQILFFAELNLFTDEDLHNIKAEMLDLINAMEHLAQEGRNAKGKTFWMYLAHIDFESNYIYANGDDFEVAFIDVYKLHSIISYDPVIIGMHRRWIESLKKYSSLLSASADKERHCFFKKQRELIEQKL